MSLISTHIVIPVTTDNKDSINRVSQMLSTWGMPDCFTTIQYVFSSDVDSSEFNIVDGAFSHSGHKGGTNGFMVSVLTACASRNGLSIILDGDILVRGHGWDQLLLNEYIEKQKDVITYNEKILAIGSHVFHRDPLWKYASHVSKWIENLSTCPSDIIYMDEDIGSFTHVLPNPLPEVEPLKESISIPDMIQFLTNLGYGITPPVDKNIDNQPDSDIPIKRRRRRKQPK